MHYNMLVMQLYLMSLTFWLLSKLNLSSLSASEQLSCNSAKSSSTVCYAKFHLQHY